VRGIGRLRRTGRRIADLFVPRTIILLYHRIAELPSDPQLLCVSREHFGEHLQILRTLGRPERLTTLSQTWQNRSPGSLGVAITFDDGYADSLYNAKPLLQQYEMPATVFVASGYIGSQRGFWKDILARIFLQPGTLPRTLRLSIVGSTYVWDLGESAHYSSEVFERHRCWNVSLQNDPTARQCVYRTLCQLLQILPDKERAGILEELLTWAEVQPDDCLDCRVLSADEIVQLAEGGLVNVGSHTISHPVLSSLDLAAQREEIRRSRLCLEGILDSRITSFAYPYGGRSHYTAETVAAVHEAGFELACSNFNGIVRHGADIYQLPRFLVRDWDGEEFARQLGDWLSD
jgi:peptidoglycan/xylan/chitin deacetylase (PgdA/CDA1 family)